MPEDDNTFTRFFIRFRRNVDAHVAAAIRNTLGIPSIVSKSVYDDGRWPETENSTLAPGGQNLPSGNPRSDSTSNASKDKRSLQGQSLWSLLPAEALAGVEAFSEAMYQFAWLEFIINSPHSPLQLRHLPQPVPRDLPKGADPSVFGFDDAFEDLLSVTSGQGLMDINERYLAKKEWRRAFPQGLPPMLWLHQLSRQGLWDGWEPRPEVLEGAVRERWKRWLGAQNDPFHTGTAIDGVGDTTSGKSGTQPSPQPGQEHDTSSSLPREAQTEEELYQLIEHGKVLARSVQEAVESVSRLGNLAWGQQITDDTSTRESASREPPAGHTEMVRIEERINPNGHKSVTKTRILYDDQGRMVSRTTETKTEPSQAAGGRTDGISKGD